MPNANLARSLKTVPMLSGLSKRDHGRLAKAMKERTFPSGREVVVEGKAGVGFFVILGGTAVVTIGGTPLRSLGPGDHFGEMALISGGERTATVTADSELTCATMTAWEFKSFVADHPSVAWAMLGTLAERLVAAQSA